MAVRTTYAAGALTALAVALTAVLVALGGRAAQDPPQPERSPEPAPSAVLAAWDADRVQAWAAGDVGRLASLYTEDSATGTRDVAMLARYVDRGLRVEGLRMQRLSVTPVAETPGRWVLRVADRVAGGSVVGDRWRVSLPRDRPSVHTIVLRLVDGSWRVDTVEPVGPRPISPRRQR